ncbi:MAG: FHA domain-containing protein [Blautia sp.]|nr:FHA domain-containing protein [Blautia sp.]
MGIMITVYTTSAYQEYLLPSEKNIDHKVILKHTYFGLKDDLAVSLENLGGQWRICPSDDYEVFKGKEKLVRPARISGEDLFRISTRNKENITFLPSAADRPLTPFRKFILRDGMEIRIGRGNGNHIRYNNRDLIAREHAVLKAGKGSCRIVCCSSNGVYVNGTFLRTDRILEYGDYINILGLRLVWLGEYLAVNGGSRDVFFDETCMADASESLRNEIQSFKAGPVTDRQVYFHRSPRFLEIPEEGTLEIEDPPASVKKDETPLFYALGPSFTMVLPMVFGSAMMMYAMSAAGGRNGLFLYSGLVMAGTSACVSVFWAIMNRRRRTALETDAEEQRFVSYSSYLLDKKEELQEKYTRNRDVMNRMYPSASEVMSTIGESSLLWNRNPGQKDFLTQRLGTGDAPFQIVIKSGERKFSVLQDPLADKPSMLKKNFETLHQVPVLADMRAYHQIGIISSGKGRENGAVARLMMLQTAAACCYSDVKLVLVYNGDDPDACEFWNFARWLPHTWSDDRKTRYIASDRKEAGDIFYELASVFRHRVREDRKPSMREGFLPYYIMFIADPRLIEGEAICGYIFDHASSCGLTTVFMSERYDELPNTCGFFAEDTESFSGIYEAEGRNLRTEVEYDHVNTKECENFSRGICGIRVQNVRGEGKIPGEVGFLEMYGVNTPEELNPAERWLKNRTYENIRGCIGRKAGDAPMYLDIHEKYHGPHGLVAGMTGSGKSETLQTFILSLAVNYSPDDIAFFIIDYKGGGLANLFEGLPHIAGSISNLSGNHIQRAMASIKSENRRRQKILGNLRINHIDAYTRMYKSGECTEPMPHLVIVIDEFAELKKEEPDFMMELISVAQVGRSLGVHLILATQKPGGVVDESIRSNSRFRLCLRVQNRQDSMDMLGKADASAITGVGRCCLQVGNDEIFEQFQSGWSGAVYTGENGESSGKVRMISLTGKKGSATSGSRKASDSAEESKKEISQLEAVAGFLKHTAREEGYKNSRLLWLPPLKAKILQDDLVKNIAGSDEESLAETIAGSGVERNETHTGYEKKTSASDSEKTGISSSGKNNSISVPVGLLDIPDMQSQKPLIISLPDAGHIAVCGTVVSGKTTFLQTFASGLVKQYSPAQVNIYGIDLSGKSMEEYRASPHFGGLMYEDDPEKLRRFFKMLERICVRRKEAFHGTGFTDYSEAETDGEASGPEHKGRENFPSVFVMIDNYAAFREKTGDAYDAFILNLSREGLRLGIYLVISAAGFSMSEIGSRLRENIRTVICLGAEDRFTCADMFRTIRIETMPASGIHGRGLALYDGRVLEFQTALANDGEGDFERQEGIRALCLELRERYKGHEAERVPEIPRRPVWRDFLQNPEVQKKLVEDNVIPAGYFADDADIYALSPEKHFCCLVSGERESGKTNFLRILIRAAMQKRMQVYIIDSSEHPLSGFRSEPHIIYASNEEEILDTFRNSLSPLLTERNQIKKEMTASGKSTGSQKNAGGFQAILIAISDIADLITGAQRSDKNMNGFLEMLFSKGRGYGLIIAGELSMEKKHMVSGQTAFRAFISSGTGIHFGGRTANNTFLKFDYLDFREQNRAMKPGTGLLPGEAGSEAPGKIIVPLDNEE